MKQIPQAKTPPSSQSAPAVKSGPWIGVLSACLFLIALAHYFYAVSIGWNNSITDSFDFRQTQCAISTYYMVRGPLKLAYETPILGVPWSIPFEFPVYQWATALIVRAFSTPLEQTGRFVAICFYLLTFVPAYFLLGHLKVASRHRLMVLAILLASPFYTFWSRTFMIETTALFFGLSYLACGLPAFSELSRRNTVLAVVLGSLAALTKSTTFPGYAAAICLYGVRDFLKWPLRWPGNAAVLRTGVRLLILVGIPLFFGLAWAHYADCVKGENPLGHYLNSEWLKSWNFGTMEQKLSLDVWNRVLLRSTLLFFSDLLFWAFLLTLLLVVVPFAPHRWKELVSCLLLFLLAPAIFTNLHWVHDYYMCANGIFLIGAAGFLVISSLEKKKLEWLGVAAAIILVLLGFHGHQSVYTNLQRQNLEPAIKVARVIRDRTNEDDVNIIIGFNYGSLYPYYSERRALMIPDLPGVPEEARQEALRKAFLSLREKKLGIMFVKNFPQFRAEAQYWLGFLEKNGMHVKDVLLVNSP